MNYQYQGYPVIIKILLNKIVVIQIFKILLKFYRSNQLQYFNLKGISNRQFIILNYLVMDSEFLKYGDQICLYSDEAAGYLTTIGFNAPKLYVQHCSKLHRSHIVNVSNFVFEVIPKLSYDCMKEWRREKKAEKLKSVSKVIESIEDKTAQAEKMKQLEKRIRQQNYSNECWIEKMFGKRVLYGQQIQLRHKDSGMYLQHAKKASQIDRRCQEIELVPEPSQQRVTFFINQRYNYRQEGEAVVYNDNIILFNTKYNCYLHISLDQIQEQVKVTGAPSKYRPLSPQRRVNPDTLYKRLEVNCSSNFFKWQVVPYRQFTRYQRKNFIFSGDFVRLKHAETAGYLCHDDMNQDQTGDPVYVRVYKGQDTSDRFTTNNLFEIELHSDFKQETVANAGTLMTWQERGPKHYIKVRFRHVNSGKLLTLSTTDRPAGKNKDKKQSKGSKKMILCLGDNLTSEKVNWKLDNCNKLERENKNNFNFNFLSDPKVMKITKGVNKNQQFEIENTVVDNIMAMKNNSVVKIYNRFLNPTTGALQHLTISTELKQKNDENAAGEGDEEPDLSVFDNPDIQSQNISGNQSKLEASRVQEEISMYKHVEDNKNQEQHETEDSKYTPMGYDESEHIQILLTKLVIDGSMDDVFIVERASDEEVKSVLFIHSCIPKIKEFTYNLRFNHSVLTSPYIKTFEDMLSGLIFFVINTEGTDPSKCEGFPVVQHQKFLREIKIIDLLVDIIIYPFEATSENEKPLYILEELKQRSPMTRVCQLIYRLLKHSVKDNDFNKFYVAQWISHFFYQSMMTTEDNNLYAEDTIEEILRNNRQLLDKQIDMTVIKNIVENLHSTQKNDRFLSLLCQLCSCNDEAVGTNQDNCCELFLNISGESHKYENLLIKVKPKGDKHYVYFEEEEFKEEIEITELQSRFTQLNDMRLYNYFQTMINLVSLMCQERNYPGITGCENQYTLEFLLDSFLKEEICYPLRSNIARALNAVHIDQKPLEQIKLPSLTRVWDDIKKQLMGIETQIFKIKDKKNNEKKKLYRLLELKSFVINFFESMGGVQRSFKTELNNFTIEVLKILDNMIMLGFYENEEQIVEILNPVISLLDGSMDFTSIEEEEKYEAWLKKNQENAHKPNFIPDTCSRDKDKRYKQSPDNEKIFAIKKKVIQMLTKILNFQDDIRLSKFLIEFYKADQKMMKNPHEAGPELYFLQNVLTNNTSESENDIRESCNDKVITWLRTAFYNKNLDMKSKSKRDIICILLDMILYQDSVLVNSSFTLLAKYFSQKRSIIHYASQVQILQDEQEVAIFKKTKAEIKALMDMAEQGEEWMGNVGISELNSACIFIRRIEKLTELCIYNPDRKIETNEKKKKKDDDDDDGGDDEGGDGGEFEGYLNIDELKQLWDNEDPKICDDDQKNDLKNQILLKNLVAYQAPILIIKMGSLEDAEDQNAYLRVLEKCYIFLLKFVRNNPQNQKVLLEYIDLFISDMEYGVHAWELIAEIFKNSDMLATYNLNPILRRAIKLIDNLPKETQKKTILLSFLNYFIDINGVPRRENQNLIQTEITSQSRKNMEHLFTEDQGLNDLHLYLLEMKNSYQEFMADERFLPEIQIPPELSYTIEFIRLLGHNGEGKNSITEGIASDRLPLDDLIENLRMADFCYPLKSSLVYFMDTIYFDIEKEVTDENIAKMNMVIDIISQDLEKFIRIEQRVMKAKDGKPKIGVEQIDADDLEKVDVDINKNFNLMTAFGSFPIVILMEYYVFEIVFPALKNYFDLRLSIKQGQKKNIHQLFMVIQKVVSFAKKDSHFEKADQLFKTIKKIPQLKEFGGETLQNKLLTQYITKKNALLNPQKKTEVDLMVALPNLTQAEKLKAYLLSCETSEKLMEDFEKEFEDIVYYIINIKNKTESAFEGTNTLDVKDLIRSLIQISGIESDINPNLRIICLKVMRKVIELENQSGTQAPALDWDDDWDKYEEEIAKKQAMLIELEVINLICDLIAFEEKRNIKEEGLLVAVALLLGGNVESQNKFHEYIVSDQGNTFVCSLQLMLCEAFDYLRETQVKRNEQKLKLIGIEKKIEEVETMPEGKLKRLEMKKLKDQQRLTDDDIKATDQDDSENPSSYITNDLTVNRANRNCIAILKFLQLLCEGHNLNLQDILREQINEDGKMKLNSFDFISYLAKQLESFLQVFNDQTFDVCNQIVDTLVESIQGPCEGNQKAMVQNKIIDTSREIIASFEKQVEIEHLGFSKDDIDDIGEFKGNVIQLLTSLLEGETNFAIIDTMTMSLDFDTMKNRMCQIFARFASKILSKESIEIKDVPIHKIDSLLEGDSFQEIIQEAFQLYILLHTLADSTKMAAQQLQKEYFSFDQWKVSEFIRSHTGRIEILMNGSLSRIYFPISPICQLISKQTRKKLMTDVCRESQQSKVRDLLYAVPNLIDEMNHNDELNRATFKITPERLMFLKDFSSVIGLIMNVTFLSFATRKYHYKILEVPEWVIDTIEYLGYVQGSSSLILIFFFGINKKKLITNIMWRDMISENEKKAGYELPENDDRLTVNQMSYEMTHMILMMKGPDAVEFNFDENNINFGNWFTYSEYHLLNTYFFIQDGTFQYYVLYFAISLLGKYSQDIYYSFHLLDVINRSVVLQNVMLAISMNIVQVMMTIMLMMIFVYIYTVMTFFYLQDGMYDYDINAYDSDIVGENNCLSMFQCLVTQLDKGLRNGGGVGDITEPVHFNDETEKYLFKLAHDASFQIIVNIICLNIIFGIVVNSFAELRDQKSKNDFDTHNRCYICNLEYMVFDRAVEGGFPRHIEKDHNLWQYVFYIVHLNSKQSSDYDGVETFVSDKLEEDVIDWVPNAIAMCLQQGDISNRDSSQDDPVAVELAEIKDRVSLCAKAMDEISKKLTKKQNELEEERKQAEVDANNRSSSVIIGVQPADQA